MRSERSKVRRVPKRASYDVETVYAILDKECVCQVGFVSDGHPVVIPTIYGRSGDHLYFHGANTSRMLQHMEEGVPISVNVTRTNALVLARSAFHHSLNYESVTLFGTAKPVEEREEKLLALEMISEQVLPGRWQEVRQPSEKELQVTRLMKLQISEGSAKVRNEGVNDDKEDYDLDVWAGLVPIRRSFGAPVPDERLREGITLPGSVKRLQDG